MQVVNISRATAEKMPWIVGNKDWLISIHSCGKNPANITAKFGKVFRFEFDDLHEFEPPNHQPINEQQAKEIAEIIRNAEKEEITCLWVHCDAGVCRSGAVVAAAMLLGHKPDDEVSNERIPNEVVFHAIRKALGLLQSWES